MNKIPIALEIGPKRRVFAQALDWIGWCRAGKDERTALHQLLTTSTRYEQVAQRASLPFTAPTSLDELEIVERVQGSAMTDFGALGALFAVDQQALEEGEIERLVRLLSACWATFDDVLQTHPADLYDVKPERGRSLSAMRLHLLETDRMHMSAFGLTSCSPEQHAPISQQEEEVREQFLDQLRAMHCNEAFTPQRKSGFSWTPHFAARRSAWHALDHAWQLQDRVKDAL